MRSENCGWMLETLDQQSADVIGRVIDRSHDLAAASRAQPVSRGFKQRRRHVTIVDALEEAEAADVALMERIVIGIVTRHHAANDLAVPPRQKKRGIAMFVKWMPLAVEKRLSFKDQGRHPSRIVFIDPPWKFDKSVTFAARTDF